NLDWLAGQGVSFTHAFSHAPWTLPAFASLFTSLPPQAHGAGGRADHYEALAGSFETLAERFAASGYVTGAIANVDFLGRRTFGLLQGFEKVDARCYQDNQQVREARLTTDAAIHWLESRAGERSFLLVHYFDPHARYAPPQPWRRRFADPRDQESEAFELGD